MAHWASIVMENYMATFDKHRKAWNHTHDLPVSRLIEDRARLITALRDLLTTVQVEYPRPSMRVLRAEAVAVAALQAMDQADEPIVGPI